MNFHQAFRDTAPDDDDRMTGAAIGMFASAAVLAGKPVPPRRWHVDGLVPCDTVTMLGGDGGTGKSLLALQLAIATAMAGEWIGRPVDRPGKVLFLSAEDDRDELHRRMADICAAEGHDLSDLSDLLFLSLAGESALLATADPRGALHASPLYQALDREMAEHGPALLVLDTLADLHTGNENDRATARQFRSLTETVGEKGKSCKPGLKPCVSNQQVSEPLQTENPATFAAALASFHAATGRLPPAGVFHLHPAFEPLAQAVVATTDYRGEAAEEVAADLLASIETDGDGRTLSDGQTAAEIAEEIENRAIPSPTFDALGRLAIALIGDDPPDDAPLREAWEHVRATPAPPYNPAAYETDPDAARWEERRDLCAFRALLATDPEDKAFWEHDAMTTYKIVDIAAERERQRGKAERIAEATEAARQAKEKRKFRFVAVGDLEIKPTEYLVGDLIETDSFGVLFGEPGCGKSFLAVDLAMCVASGAAFHGRAVRQGPVLFIAGEGHSGLARRFAAWGQDRGVSLAGVPLFKSERAAAFLDAAHAREVATAVDALAAERGAPALIVVDTLARNFGGGDENSTQDMGRFVQAMDALRARYPGCTVLIVHHSGHADKDRGRGSIALKAACDFEYRLDKRGTRCVELVNCKMKDAERPESVAFGIETVALGGGAESAVLRPATIIQNTEEALTPAQRLGIATYIEAAARAGIWGEDGFTGLYADEWRSEFYAKHTGDNYQAKKKAFQRVRTDLVNAGHMVVNEDVYTVTAADVIMEIKMAKAAGGQGT